MRSWKQIKFPSSHSLPLLRDLFPSCKLLLYLFVCCKLTGLFIIYTSKLKKLNFRKGYRDCIKRSGDKAWMQSTRYIVTSCHGNDDKMWSTSCLIIQHKPYIVELSFMETQESINEGLSITMEGPFQTNVVLVPLHDVTCRNHQTEFKCDIKLYTPYPCHLSHSLAHLHIL